MTIKTRFFGEVEVFEDKIIKFENGLPGFENLKKFLFMTNETGGMFYWLQSIEDTDIVFTIVDIFQIMPDYNPIVLVENMEELGGYEDLAEDISIYNIAVIPKDIKQMTVNLKAPIIINLRTNKAKQIICNNDEYKIKFKVYDLIKKEGE